jgi:hypothetical protein
MLSHRCSHPLSILPSSAVPCAPVFGFSPRLAVHNSNGHTFVSVGSGVLIFDADHSQIVDQRRLFPYGCVSCISHSDNCLVAGSGSRLCIWTDSARADGAEPHVFDCGLTRVLFCAYSSAAIHPLVAVLQGGGCRGTGAAVHFSATAHSRPIAARTVDAPAWPSQTGGMCSCACVTLDTESCRQRFVCASGVPVFVLSGMGISLTLPIRLLHGRCLRLGHLYGVMHRQ